MIGLAVAGALLHLVQFYYLLGVSLAVKSYIMLGVGLVLLLSARSLRLGEPMPSATAASAGAAS
jgi:uncharacterized membrane protein